jgi:hypothetical protein
MLDTVPKQVTAVVMAIGTVAGSAVGTLRWADARYAAASAVEAIREESLRAKRDRLRDAQFQILNTLEREGRTPTSLERQRLQEVELDLAETQRRLDQLPR